MSTPPGLTKSADDLVGQPCPNNEEGEGMLGGKGVVYGVDLYGYIGSHLDSRGFDRIQWPNSRSTEAMWLSLKPSAYPLSRNLLACIVIVCMLLAGRLLVRTRRRRRHGKERHDAASDKTSKVTVTTLTPHGQVDTEHGIEDLKRDDSLEIGFCPTMARQFTGGCPESSGRKEPIGCQGIYGLGGYSQSSRLLLCMVGLPACGKSYITKMLERYLQWSGFPAKIFNAGNMRRQGGMAGASASFFDSSSKEASALRESYASACLEEAISWLKMQESVSVAIFDATNTSRKRRTIITTRCNENKGLALMFVESICDNPAILEANYKLKCENADYQGQDPIVARADFLDRVSAYKARYETVSDDESHGEVCYIKVFNVGDKVVMYHCAGYLASQIGCYLSNVHISPRSIWLTLPAESNNETSSNSDNLTARGKQYCKALADFLSSRRWLIFYC